MEHEGPQLYFLCTSVSKYPPPCDDKKSKKKKKTVSGNFFSLSHREIDLRGTETNNYFGVLHLSLWVDDVIQGIQEAEGQTHLQTELELSKLFSKSVSILLYVNVEKACQKHICYTQTLNYIIF